MIWQVALTLAAPVRDWLSLNIVCPRGNSCAAPGLRLKGWPPAPCRWRRRRLVETALNRRLGGAIWVPPRLMISTVPAASSSGLVPDSSLLKLLSVQFSGPEGRDIERKARRLIDDILVDARRRRGLIRAVDALLPVPRWR